MAKSQSRPATGKSGSRPSTTRGGGTAGARPGGSRPSAGNGRAGNSRPSQPGRKPSTSIVNKPQRPWGLIAMVTALAVFAAGVIGYAVWKGQSGDASGDAAAQAARIPGIYVDPALADNPTSSARNHETGTVQYSVTPPIGGNHSPYWADCTGTVYSQPIASENAVHALEHGAVWVTYNPSISSDDLAQLVKLVQGNDRLMLSPYPDLQSPISLQSWGYQLAVDSPADSRIPTFIGLLRYNPETTPEYGATCQQPTFKANPSTFGNPLSAPAA